MAQFSSSVAIDAVGDISGEAHSGKRSIIRFHPKGSHNLFTVPEGCQSRDTQKESARARCEIEWNKLMDDVARSTKSGDLTTADLTILNVVNQSRYWQRNALILQDDQTKWIQGCPMKNTKTTSETTACLQRFFLSSQKLEIMCTAEEICASNDPICMGSE